MRDSESEVDGTKSRPRKMTFKELETFLRNHDQPFCHGQQNYFGALLIILRGALFIILKLTPATSENDP